MKPCTLTFLQILCVVLHFQKSISSYLFSYALIQKQRYKKVWFTCRTESVVTITSIHGRQNYVCFSLTDSLLWTNDTKTHQKGETHWMLYESKWYSKQTGWKSVALTAVLWDMFTFHMDNFDIITIASEVRGECRNGGASGRSWPPISENMDIR